MKTYLGQKGYTILKNELSLMQQNEIRDDLMVKPYIPGNVGNALQKSFPAYRESSNKLYVPHYYGEDKFGPAKELRIPEGENIALEFNGKLRENQEIVVNTYLNYVNNKGYGGGLLELPCAYGKCLGKNTEILMFDGTIKKVQDIRVGDVIMGDDSTPRKILSLARGREKMYRVYNDFNNVSYIVNQSHILSLKYYYHSTYTTIDIPIDDYLILNDVQKDCYHGFRTPILFKERKTQISPYYYGYDFPCGNPSINIHIDYKCNSVNNRLLLLAGIIDGLHDDTTTYYNCFQLLLQGELLKDVVYIARSLGFISYIRRSGDTKYCFIYDSEEVLQKNNSSYLYNLCCNKITSFKNNLMNIPLKKKRFEHSKNSDVFKDNLSYHIDTEELGVDDYYGFEIDGNRRFVLADFTVTHNTVLSLNIISKIQKKTFIIVHKEFLMNQWIERIEQFLPKAKIGKIQGQIIDINDKDIVIGMLQSISMKEYPANLFECFGLTIIDEVHHISSEVFSNSLFKLVTKYMLGLSATMNRKDGTTKVFKMFLGPIVFKGKRDEAREVVVRAIEYYVNDDEFNKVVTDYRGNTQYSTMISKLCEYNHRSEFILRILKDMFCENEDQQIMILAHNKNLLKYLHDSIKHKNIATVGYYVGGMKESALKETESKKVVIATYAMAAEALDIKTLTTLIMATPKTDIEQSVGRILREKHSNPIVVDIIDSHDTFKNQWKKRRAFYIKENYKILYTKNTIYNPDINSCSWNVVYEPGEKSIKSLKKIKKDDEDPCLQGKCLINIKLNNYKMG